MDAMVWGGMSWVRTFTALFHNAGLRRSILAELAARKGVALALGDKVISKEEQYDKLAALVRGTLDMGPRL